MTAFALLEEERDALAQEIAKREHAVNNLLATLRELRSLVRSLDQVLDLRPGVVLACQEGGAVVSARTYPCVVETEDDAAVLLGPGRVQMRAVKVGKGVEITLSDRYHGWIPWQVTKPWSKAIKRLGKQAQEWDQ